MQTIDELLALTPALGGLTGDHLAVIAGCAHNEVFQPDDRLLREGDPENEFFVIRKGSVALETYVPSRGAVIVQTLHDGDLLGWSWLVPPYRAAFDARVLDTTHTITFDAACLRGKAEADPALGHDLMKVFVGVIVQRLQATRLQLLDVYAPRA